MIDFVHLFKQHRPSPCKYGNIVEENYCVCMQIEGPDRCPLYKKFSDDKKRPA